MSKFNARECVIFVLTFVLLGGTGCATKQVKMIPATSVPAAMATARLTRDDNGNTIVHLKVKHLAKPENLTPAKSAYIVWIQSGSDQPIKQGQLRVNSSLEGEFESPTAYKTFDIFVTAEDSSSVAQLRGPEILRQTVTA